MKPDVSKEVLTLDSFSFNSINPFLDQIIVHITENKNTAMASAIGHKDVLNPETGELEAERVLFLKKTTKVVDHEQYCKLYFGAFKTFFNLPNSAIDLMWYIMNNIQFGNDRICLHVATVVDEMGVTKSCIYKAIVRLLSANIIAKADKKNCYFINPSVLFKGERISLINEFVNSSGERFEETSKKLIKGEAKKKPNGI